MFRTDLVAIVFAGLAGLYPCGLHASSQDEPTAPEEVPKEPDPYEGLDHTGTPPLPEKESQLPPQSAQPGEKRPLVDYDGKPGEAASAGEVLIWIPRVIFFPVYAVLEYVVRYPIVWTISKCEEHHIPAKIVRFFTFNEGQGGLFPTFFYDFGVSPSMGLYFFYDDLGFEHNNLVVQGGYWPEEKYNVIVTDSFKVFRNNQGTVTVRALSSNRPDRPFYGLGSNPGSVKRFYQLQTNEAEISLRAALKDLNRVSMGLIYRNSTISSGKSPSVDGSDSPFDVNDPDSVPGFGRTYNLLTAKAKLEFDSRSPDRPYTPGSGLRLEAFSSFSLDVNNPDLHFLRWGGEVAGFLDLSGINHVLALRIYSEMLENFGELAVPITELILVGGKEYLRGFLGGQLRGDSAFVVTADYRYPIHAIFDANIFVSLGNVFDGRLSNLRIQNMVMSWGIGVRSNTSRNVSFDIMVAFGSNPLGEWEQDFDLDNVRFLVGLNQGF